MTDDVQETVDAGAEAARDAAEEQAETASTAEKGSDETAARIAQLEQQVQENVNGWQRSRAEFANYRKRTERELKESVERGALDTITRLLPIIDDFERAVANVPAELEGNPWVNGTTMILQKFEKLLEEYHVKAVDPVGEPFDPRLHEGIGMEESDEVESGHVTVTLQKGYVSGERVLRPALVRVAN